jgi:hypothetical protein
MIKSIPIIFAALILLPTISAAQNTSMKRLQWGAEARYDIYDLNESMASGDVSLGWRFNRKNYVGIRAGFGKGSTYKDDSGSNYNYNGIPLLADYIHYFPVGKSSRNSFFIGGEAGPVFQHYTEEFKEEDQKDMSKNDSCPFAGFMFGFEFAMGKPYITIGLQANMIGFGCRLGVIF